MKIVDAVFSKGYSAFFFDDQKAIKSGADHDGFVYVGEPMTPGFSRIRQAGQSISVMLILEDGQMAVGDCAAVQYSGAGGRDPLFLASEYVPFLQEHIRPLLQGLEIGSFREMAKHFSELKINKKPLHSAIKYGLTMALLDARAKALKLMPCEVVCQEYDLPVIAQRVPIFGQTGDNRYDNADKMILKGVEVLPHGLINNIDEKLGRHGEKLREYIKWLVKRVDHLRTSPDYKPNLHIDVYGNVGPIFDNDTTKVAQYLASLEPDAGELPLYIEGPVDMGDRGLQIEKLREITVKLRDLGSSVKIVADEWCNTIEDIRDFADAGACHMIQIKTPDLGGVQNIVESILYCREKGVGAYQGGTCNETDLSARMCVHLAVAARAERMLAKPGMGFDEGFSIVNNEMERILAVLRYRNGVDHD
ncbi:MAG: methylaspartate ammonia-lyase [Myxococcota bacterium]|jgi:methylaspartate ammonia-lyase|nr:methylaspartate ammonia-lyase [Myxococcota bacterium]MBP8971680.1 methylaspartate ammonia-lyase [Myxococcota bacterium]HHW97629.1 methylaspartate ammonia-lyase [Oligoflexales bacterium]HQC44561.1 methylaspartate ammonia-lyase [Myxococcota bacterium]HQL58016.1 methylaspartate ammonia-lyase [Myxococcota bacterium]